MSLLKELDKLVSALEALRDRGFEWMDSDPDQSIKIYDLDSGTVVYQVVNEGYGTNFQRVDL